MFKVLMVEDRASDAQALERMLARYAEEHDEDFQVTRVATAMELPEDHNPYDLIFMDIGLPGINGMEAAQLLRSYDTQTPLIFVTDLAQYAVHGYQVDALDFIVKPVEYYDFALRLDRALRIARRERNDKVTIVTRDGMRVFRTSDLVFVDIMGHDLSYHLANGETVTLRGSLTKAAEQLPEESLVRIYDSKVKTGNDALDTILSEKRLLCEREGTRLTCIADGAALSGLSPADLYSLFGNLLDNAIEAVRRLDGAERRTISLVVSRRGDMAVIHEENYFDGDVRFEGGLPVSTKGDPLNHGFGTRSMSQIVERYGGSMSMRAQGDRFGVTIVLPA